MYNFVCRNETNVHNIIPLYLHQKHLNSDYFLKTKYVCLFTLILPWDNLEFLIKKKNQNI